MAYERKKSRHVFRVFAISKSRYVSFSNREIQTWALSHTKAVEKAFPNKWFINTMKQFIVSHSPEVMGGAPVFFGTRVPVQTLLDYLEGGDSIDEFLAGFPSVTREQVIAFLEQAQRENRDWLTGPPAGRELI